MPAGVQRRADVVAMMTACARSFGLLQQIEQGLKGSGMTTRVAVLSGFRDSIVNTRSAAGNGADHTARLQFPNEILEEPMEFAVSHRARILLRDGLVEVPQPARHERMGGQPDGVCSPGVCPSIRYCPPPVPTPPHAGGWSRPARRKGNATVHGPHHPVLELRLAGRCEAGFRLPFVRCQLEIAA